jgi:hypothetical protein
MHFYRLQQQLENKGAMTTTWRLYWNPTPKPINPPPQMNLPRTAEYIQRYIMDTAYILREKYSESARAYKQRIYDTLQYYYVIEHATTVMRIERLQPTKDWKVIWRYIHQQKTKEPRGIK